jgi:hypothetical protein
MHSAVQTILLFQGLYYAVTGIWPLVHMRSFLTVTGPKHDLWLAKTVGILVLVIGAVLISAALRKETVPEIVALAAGSAVGLTIIDANYSLKNRISKVYLLDAIGEIILLALLTFATAKGI